MRSAKLASSGIALSQNATHSAATRYDKSPRKIRLGQIRLELRNRHRRGRRQVIGVDDLEQALCETRELSIELELHPSGQKCGAFEQPLHIGVRNFDSAHAEPPRDLGKLLGKLGPHFSKMRELLVVMADESWIHGLLLSRKIANFDLSAFQVDLGAQ